MWDASQLDTYQACSFMYSNRYLKQRVPLTIAQPLDRGDLVHIGAESYYNSLQAGGSYEKSVDDALLSISTRAALHSDLPDYEIDHIKRVMELYFDFWRVEDQNWHIDAVEESFAYNLFEDDTFRIIMTGKIDLMRSNNRYTRLPVDTKSFQRDFEVLRKTNQFINYAIASDSNYLLVNRIGLHELDTKKPKPLHERFKRVPLSYDPVYKQQWKDNIVVWAMKYYDSVSNNIWETNDTSCNKFGRICEYYDVCDSSGKEAKEFKLSTDFKMADKWDVTAKLGATK